MRTLSYISRVHTSCRQIYNIFRDVVRCTTMKQDVRFDVDIRELSAVTRVNLDDNVPDIQTDATAVVEACINASWFASLELVMSKPKYLLFQHSVNPVDGAVPTRSPMSKKRKSQWGVSRSSQPQQTDSEVAGAPIPAQRKRTRTESDVLRSEPVCTGARFDYALTSVLTLSRCNKRELDSG